MRMLRVRDAALIAGAAAGFVVLTGCAAETPVDEVRQTFRPVVSLNQVMVSVVDHNAHILWNVALPDYAPANDADWHELEHAAVTLAAAGNTILLGGSGPDDAKWVDETDWESLTQAETDAALDALLAIDNKDLNALLTAGDSLTDTCEACHMAHKPDLPSIVATPEEQPEHFYRGKGAVKQ